VATDLIAGHVNIASGFRGGERQTQLLMQQLSQLGWRQRLVARRGGELAARCADIDGLDIREVAPNLIAASSALSGVSMSHAHEARAVYACWLRRMLSSAPYVITRRVDNLFKSSLFRDRAYDNASVVACLSNAIAGIVRDKYPSARIELIPSAHASLADTSPDGNPIRRIFPGKILVGHIGALVQHHKGQKTIIHAAPSLQQSHPELQFVLLGEGKDGDEMRQMAKSLPNISFEGQVTNVADYLAAFDLFAFPSMMEGLGSTLLDAMCFGLPIVASRVGGIPDIVEDGVNGLLVEPGDASGFTAAVQRLLGDENLRAQFRSENLRRADAYSAAAMAKSYDQLYRNILKI
jgi:glycosyltransferase involved in cell wall biosynthesis